MAGAGEGLIAKEDIPVMNCVVLDTDFEGVQGFLQGL